MNEPFGKFRIRDCSLGLYENIVFCIASPSMVGIEFTKNLVVIDQRLQLFGVEMLLIHKNASQLPAGVIDRVLDEDALREQAESVGFPLMMKATAGGGGRGIRRIEIPDELEAAFDSATQEAANAFGDGTLFLEACVEQARHIEVQIAADAHGGAIALGLRDCSVQRRHQKIVEEGPPTGV
ncbi:MAG: hypothetical protein IH802_13030, partial [Nitrospinae bacterium]|nr:hypothetical protein [Nitrospinota bacterium]